MATEEVSTELDTQVETTKQGMSNPTDTAADGIQGEQSANPSGVVNTDGKTIEREAEKNHSHDDKVKFAFQKERARRKEAERKMKSYMDELEQLKASIGNKSAVDSIDDRIKMAMLQGRMEEFNQHNQQASDDYENEIQSHLASRYFANEDLQKYNNEIAPLRQKALARLNELNPIVARYVKNSNASPLLLKAFLNPTDGMDVFNEVDSEDSMITWRNMERLEDRLIQSLKANAEPVTEPKIKAPVSKSVNAPLNNNQTISKEDIRKLFG